MRDAEAVSEEEQKEYEPTSEDDELDIDPNLDDDDLADDFSPAKPKRGAAKAAADEPEEDLDDTVFIDNLPKEETQIRVMLKEVNKHIRDLERKFFEEEDSEQDELQRQELMDDQVSIAEHNRRLEELKQRSHITQFFSIPLSDNVKSFDFERLAEVQKRNGGRLFDVISCDPPWQLSSANPTRGVAIAYDTLTNPQILDIPFHKLQESGYLLIWVINAKYRFAMEMFEENGYTLVDEVAWVKQTVNGKIAKGHGFYLQHAKETCLIGAKGDISKKGIFNIKSDVIFS
jgi:mRNA (2'-O-methyladenosine-N6-)-methyltransferase